MLILIIAFILFFWLVVGALQFVLCMAVMRWRPSALSAALWWAVWGPCCIGLGLLAGLTLVVNDMAVHAGGLPEFPTLRHPLHLGTAFLVVGILSTSSVATVLAWLHQAVVRRLTFALFRLYATLVAAGIGSVFGWCFSFMLLSEHAGRYDWIADLVVMLTLIGAFGRFAYRNSRDLRGTYRASWTWLTREEFEGTSPPTVAF